MPLNPCKYKALIAAHLVYILVYKKFFTAKWLFYIKLVYIFGL